MAAGSDDERRRQTREALVLKVEYADADGLVHDYTSNISQGGTFVVTDRELPIGAEVKLVLSFPGLIKPLPLPAKVVWHGDAEGGEDRGVGVAFDLGDDAAKARLGELVARIAEGDPEVVARTLRVLVVEDNPHVAALIRDGLAGGAKRMRGHVVFDLSVAKDGREALDKLTAADWDLCIIDIYLPVLDGVAVIKALRAREATKTLPVVAVSAGGAQARAAALSAGADFFLDKPMRLADIIASIQRLTGVG